MPPVEWGSVQTSGVERNHIWDGEDPALDLGMNHPSWGERSMRVRVSNQARDVIRSSDIVVGRPPGFWCSRLNHLPHIMVDVLVSPLNSFRKSRNNRFDGILNCDSHHKCRRPVNEKRGVVRLILSQSDLLVSNTVLTVAPLHRNVQRLAVPGDSKTYGRCESELKFRCEQVLNVAFAIYHGR